MERGCAHWACYCSSLASSPQPVLPWSYCPMWANYGMSPNFTALQGMGMS